MSGRVRSGQVGSGLVRVRVVEFGLYYAENVQWTVSYYIYSMCRVVCANILINGNNANDDDDDVLIDLYPQGVHWHRELISSHVNRFPP